MKQLQNVILRIIWMPNGLGFTLKTHWACLKSRTCAYLIGKTRQESTENIFTNYSREYKFTQSMISVWPSIHSLCEALVSLPVQFVVVTIVPHSKAIFKFRVIRICKCEGNKGF